MRLKEKTEIDFLWEKGYRRDPLSRVWERPGSPEISYSDGEEAEEEIYRILKRAGDVSSASDELSACISGWPSEYHLSRARHNLLRPFEFGEGDSILELGAGCGAITRFLGETGATVFALEGARKRALIAAERCRDLPNVAVFRENIKEFPPELKFSFVTIIGVLEYSNLFLKGENEDSPFKRCLEIAETHLGQDGTLILAIENQLGLKYFNGAREDHHPVPFWGINSLYGEGSPATMGRLELSDLLRSSDFNSLEFFYPFPDYKLPEVIISERGLGHGEFNIGDLLAHIRSRDYGRTGPRSFSENLAFHALARNGLLNELSNSFLIFARKGWNANREAKWLAKSYSPGRKSRYHVENTFEQSEEGILVRRRKVFPSKIQDGPLIHTVPDAEYIQGELYIASLFRIVMKGGGPEQIARWARPWVDYLKEKKIPYKGKKKEDSEALHLPGDYIDCVPFNLIKRGGELVYFDNEWESPTPVPLNWVVVRGLVLSLNKCPARSRESLREMLDMILPRLGLLLSESDYEEVGRLEDALQAEVQVSYKGSFIKGLAAPPGCYQLSCDFLEEKEREITRLRNERDALLNSWSWKLTGPLRKVKEKVHW
jgi:hypothetical protein